VGDAVTAEHRKEWHRGFRGVGCWSPLVDSGDWPFALGEEENAMNFCEEKTQFSSKKRKGKVPGLVGNTRSSHLASDVILNRTKTRVRPHQSFSPFMSHQEEDKP
jgi:hypothetical protein